MRSIRSLLFDPPEGALPTRPPVYVPPAPEFVLPPEYAQPLAGVRRPARARPATPAADRPEPRPRRDGSSSRRDRPTPREDGTRDRGDSGHRGRWALAVLGVVLLAFGLRVWGIRMGLPYAYNSDENAHFVPRAIGLFGHNLNPGYFNNPPAYTYLLYFVYEIWYGGGRALSHTFASHPTEVWVLARAIAAVLGTLAVWLLYLCGARLFDRRTGLLAAGLMAVAFLPVFYAHLALNDVPTLAPLTLSLWGTAGVLRYGRRRDYVIAGIGLGLASATKYTGGIVVLPLIAAAFYHHRSSAGGGGRGGRAVVGIVTAGLLALIAFVLADPYSVLDFSAFHTGIAHQSAASDDSTGKLGLTHGSGITYYLWTLTWGLGWVPALAALGGSIAPLVARASPDRRARPGSRHLPPLHGLPGPVLRSLADPGPADLLSPLGVRRAPGGRQGRRPDPRAATDDDRGRRRRPLRAGPRPQRPFRPRRLPV